MTNLVNDPGVPITTISGSLSLRQLLNKMVTSSEDERIFLAIWSFQGAEMALATAARFGLKVSLDHLFTETPAS